MLRSLHVKNLALIDETEITFGPNLNILTDSASASSFCRASSSMLPSSS